MTEHRTAPAALCCTGEVPSDTWLLLCPLSDMTTTSIRRSAKKQRKEK